MNNEQLDFNAGIVGLGTYLPEKRMTEQDFINAGVPKELIDKWGVYEHRVSEPDEMPSDMSIKAAKDLISNTGIDPYEIDLIIDCALVPDYILPGNSHRIQYELGAKNAVAFDIVPSNGGVIPQLVIAKSLVLSGMYEKILITCSSKISSVVDKTDWSSLVIGGDGAAAALISKVSKNKGFLSSNMITRGEFYLNSGIKLKMHSKSSKSKGTIYEDSNKRLLFFLDDLNVLAENSKNSNSDEFYLNSVPMSSRLALEKVNLSLNDVNFWITHQNARTLSEQWIQSLGIKDKGNYYYSYYKYGNLFNVNLLVNLKEAIEKSYIKDEDVVVLSGVLVGLSAGSIVMKWGK